VAGLNRCGSSNGAEAFFIAAGSAYGIKKHRNHKAAGKEGVK
jgi:hypothetical protein